MFPSEINSIKDVKLRSLRRRVQICSEYTNDSLRDLDETSAKADARRAELGRKEEALRQQGVELQRQFEAAVAANTLPPDQVAIIRKRLASVEKMTHRFALGQERQEVTARELIRLRRRIVETMANSEKTLADLERLRAHEIDTWSWHSWRGALNNLSLVAIVWVIFNKLFRK